MNRPISIIHDGDATEIVFLTPAFQCRLSRPLSWFRVFGYGLHWRKVADAPLLFSERNGYAWGVTIGGWYVKVLRPDGIWRQL